EAALTAAIAAEPLEQKLRAVRDTPHDSVLTTAEHAVIARARALRRKATMVDDFPKDLGKSEIYQSTQPVDAYQPQSV
ncbi:MAG TPA: hypothetical protein VFI62_15255, partial [Burkholderiales bacterium]|nr:hypothetical protein [Burkholderiales bacterium]